MPDKDVVLEALPDNTVPDTSAIFSTGNQIAGSIGSALFVGVLSADVLRQTAEGVNRHAAYANGFQHSILIAAIFEVVMLLVSVWYSREMVKHDRFQHSILIAAIFEVVMLLVSVWYSREMVKHDRAKINQPA